MPKPKGKGRYGKPDLPVTGRYVMPVPRRRLAVAAGAGGLVALVLLAGGYVWEGDELLSPRPLSSAHAALEADCAACHRRSTSAMEASVGDDRCAVCHERHGDALGVYSFQSHVVYRSADFTRIGPADRLPVCRACHPEHRGRAAALIDVPDQRCLACHAFDSFTAGHPEFDARALDLPDRANLRFTHGRHVREVMRVRGLLDLERACLHCHMPEPNGRNFAPIAFDRHCGACHLQGIDATTPLPVWEAPSPSGDPGVETLAAIRARGGPGTEWTAYTGADAFVVGEGTVVKRDVRHRDPWILENLRQLRRVLYPQARAADLLHASAEVPPGAERRLYREAIGSLRAFAHELRRHPHASVHRELDRVERELSRLERRLDDPYAPLDPGVFAIGPEDRSEVLGRAQVEAFEELAGQLTALCRTCHLVRNATIARVQKDQRVYRRADFDHRAHILQRRCVDCHQRIPIELGAAADSVAAPADRAGVQNLPGIATCRQCHAPGQANSSCTTCHAYHPDTSRRSELLLGLH